MPVEVAFNLPQQWKQLESSPSALILYRSWRYMEADTGKNDTMDNWPFNLLSLNYVTELDF